MDLTHRQRGETLLADAAAEHGRLMSQLPPELADSLPVDAQGVTQAIDHLATAAGLSPSERRELIRPHAVNPAVLHARVFGAAPLARETVIGSFVGGGGGRARAPPPLAGAGGRGAAPTRSPLWPTRWAESPWVRRSGSCWWPIHCRCRPTLPTWWTRCAP